MKKIFYFVIFSSIIFAGLYYAWVFIFSDGDPGYVLIGIGHWSLETSLAVFAVILWLVFSFLYMFFRLLGWFTRIPGKAKSIAKASTVIRSQDALVSGLIDLAEGHWQRAEKTLIKYAKTSTAPLIHYLMAARAAQSCGAIDRRDDYLDQANKKLSGSEMAIGLTHSELCLARQQYEPALKILTRLQTITPDQHGVLALLHQTYMQMGAWDKVKTIMPVLNKNSILTKTELIALQVESYSQLLSNIPKHSDSSEVLDIWYAIPENIQQIHALATTFYSAMILVGAGNQIEHDITLSLAKEWDQTLLKLFGDIDSDDTQKHFEIAEQWGDLHPKDALMMQILGKLHSKAGNHEQAEIYLNKSLSLTPSVAAYQLLGELMFTQDNLDHSVALYKDGLALAIHGTINPVDDKDNIDTVNIKLPPSKTDSVKAETAIADILNPIELDKSIDNTMVDADQTEKVTDSSELIADLKPAVTAIKAEMPDDTAALTVNQTYDVEQQTTTATEDEPIAPAATVEDEPIAPAATVEDEPIAPVGAVEDEPIAPAEEMADTETVIIEPAPANEALNPKPDAVNASTDTMPTAEITSDTTPDETVKPEKKNRLLDFFKLLKKPDTKN